MKTYLSWLYIRLILAQIPILIPRLNVQEMGHISCTYYSATMSYHYCALRVSGPCYKYGEKRASSQVLVVYHNGNSAKTKVQPTNP